MLGLRGDGGAGRDAGVRGQDGGTGSSQCPGASRLGIRWAGEARDAPGSQAEQEGKEGYQTDDERGHECSGRWEGTAVRPVYT